MQQVFKFILVGALFGIFQSCSNIKVINQADIYSAQFLKQVDDIQHLYREGNRDLALKRLQGIPDSKISKAEQAKKYNLYGVMLFSKQELVPAIDFFKKAESLVDKDLYLKANIKLNLASSYFKQNKLKLTAQTLAGIEQDYLRDQEKKNFHRLLFTVSNQLEDYKTTVSSLIYLAKDVQSFKQFEDFKYKEILIGNFEKLAESERIYVLDDDADAEVVIAYLAKHEAMNRFYAGDRDAAQDVVSWLESKFVHLADVKTFIENYRFRIENYSKINSGAVGVIAPLSGKLAKYGQKVLSGVSTVIAKKKTGEDLNLYIKDNKNNVLVAKKQIQELVMKHHVSVIIGGLFPHLAKAEYLEARRLGVLYISLSPVYLARSKKNHLLIEVPGSVESQIAEVLRPEVLDKLGKKVAVLYPQSDDGYSYVNELWSMHNTEAIELTNVQSYKRGIKDYRSSVKSLLGLRYPRERREEFIIWDEIKNINKSNVRIVNVLPPVIDFDWVFSPSLPTEAIQILPTFNFYDAQNLKFIGGPSWINKKLQREKRNLDGEVFVIGNDTADVNQNFMKQYKQYNGVYPNLVDTLSYEGMLLVQSVLSGQNFDKRNELGKRVLNIQKLQGMTSSWKLEDGLWIKDMDLLRVRSNSFTKVDAQDL
ncbi:MAG: ABC transporter substrate-binding protein [Bacteriovoracaceae bacterium]|nr:ABC transporter substrate-binding protein [Bacteriovoracaceae bacterium]